MLKRALTTVLIAALILAGLQLPALAATGTALPFVKPQYFDVNGNPLNGAQLFVYQAGTSTKITTYSDAALTTPNANPVVLDSAGRASIFVPGGTLMKLVMAPSSDTDPPSSPYWTVDGVSAVPPASTSADVDVSATAGENLSTGDLVCLSDGGGGNTAGRWYKCDADFTYLSNLAPATGIANSAVTTGSTGTVRRIGRVTGLSGLVAGTLYYASATAGALTSSKPTNARAVGTADSTTTLVVVPTDVDASSTLSGNVSTGAQTIAGVKTFSSAVTLSAGATFASTSTLNNFIYAKQTSDLTKNSNTTLSDLTGLAFAVGASETWAFEFVMKGQSNTTADFKFTLTGPSAPTAVWFGVAVSSDLPTTAAVTAFSSAVAAGGANTEELIVIRGLLRNGSNAGTVQAQMAQNTSDAGTTVIRAESYVLAWRVQ